MRIVYRCAPAGRRVRALHEIGRRPDGCRRRRRESPDAFRARCRRHSSAIVLQLRGVDHRQRTLDELNQAHRRLPAKHAQVVRLERLDEDRRVAAVPSMLRRATRAASPRAAGRCRGSRSDAWFRDRRRSAVQARARAAAPARSPRRTSAPANWPSYSCERNARRSFARSVLISASVKSSVNQPVIAWPSTVFVVLRSGNFAATSVVPPISFSWRAMSTPSFVETRSGSMKSAPISAASR